MVPRISSGTRIPQAHSGFCERLRPSTLLEKMAVHPGVSLHRTQHALYFINFIILNTCYLSVSVRFSVIGPEQPVVVLPGEDAELPCHLDPRISAENMTVRWFRGKYESVVHLYQHGRDRYDYQMAEYEGRLELIKNNIRFGIVSLVIHNVRSSDSGKYSCFFDAEFFYEEAVVELKVAAVGSRPHIYLEESQNGGIQIVCISSGWYPEPEVLWEGDNGENISSSLEVNTPEGSLRFHIKVTYIIIGDTNTFSCRINNSVLSQWKESTIHISDSFFHSVSTCSITRILICASFTFLEIAFLSLAAYCYKKQRKLIQTLSARLGNLTRELGNLPQELEWRRAKSFEVRVTLDPDTAHPQIILSKHWRSVRGTGTPQPLLDNPRRFNDIYPCVLGSEGFTSGRHYWELHLQQEGGGWRVGVAGESVPRKGGITWSPEGGVWAVGGWNGQYWALASPSSPLSLRESPRKLGVYLDYEGGWLSLYNAGTMEQLYIFPQASFTQRVFPLFYLWTGAELSLL